MKIDIPYNETVNEQAKYDEHGDFHLWDVDIEVFCSCGALLAMSARTAKSGISVVVEPCTFCTNY